MYHVISIGRSAFHQHLPIPSCIVVFRFLFFFPVSFLPTLLSLHHFQGLAVPLHLLPWIVGTQVPL